MKKNLALLGVLALFLAACSSNDLSDEIVKKYEKSLNDSAQKTIQEQMNAFPNLKVDFKNFTCKADGAFIECQSSNFSLSNKESKLFDIQNIKFRSNEIYTENNTSGLISYKDYYTHLFAKHEKLEANLVFESLKLSDESIKAIENASKQLINDEKISKLIQDLSKDTYNFTYTLLTTKNDKKLNYTFSYKLDNNKENVISTNLEGNFKEEIFTLLDHLNVKFDTNQLAFNLANSSKEFEEGFNNNFEEFLKQSTFKEFKFNFNLQTNNAFSPYINMAKASLEALQNQSANEEQNLLYSQVLELINDISKDPLYKLNLVLGFKDMPVSDFINLKEESVANITINGKDFSTILKTINQLSQIGEIYP
ncbi:JlpA family lipoprotein adhesin [Campylobacter vulpis]|uniref:JlpA family lipoprotein adhesin n=1 Tax=Campylobacter vulpis TaxID=1655500 RepID=UPI000C1617E1|nr:JlpA family lipoprotein adhesin [Campylobacter vulpis]MBS4274776.1 hypothetical protein [Campylobacter vulpis]MBS4307219.1 hypothetical protein [Campylobacter vulpis]MBS4330013.1 hypothetical protein [Campylobacter vulpis]MBS4423623.1 hypothetical protein [Campylobacter vulpis]PHY91062.1 lipoprotein [Campylobacter vulpis]